MLTDPDSVQHLFLAIPLLRPQGHFYILLAMKYSTDSSTIIIKKPQITTLRESRAKLPGVPDMQISKYPKDHKERKALCNESRCIP